MRLDWTFIARFAACVAVVLTAGIAATLDPERSSAAAAHVDESDDAPLDFADARTRSAFREHQRELHPDELSSLLDTCRSDEAYRAEWTPGMGSGDFRIVDAQVNGAQVEVVKYGLVSAPGAPRGSDIGWRPTFRTTLDAQRLMAVRAGLTATLQAKAAAAVDDQIVDASRVFVETCRRGRYHYFDRAAFGWDGSDSQRIVELARSILALADRGVAQGSAVKKP